MKVVILGDGNGNDKQEGEELFVALLLLVYHRYRLAEAIDAMEAG